MLDGRSGISHRRPCRLCLCPLLFRPLRLLRPSGTSSACSHAASIRTLCSRAVGDGRLCGPLLLAAGRGLLRCGALPAVRLPC